MRDLDPSRAQRQRHVDHLRHAAQVLPMDHHVQRERQTVGANGGGKSGLLIMGPGEAGDAVIIRRREILEAELDVFQAGGGKRCDLAFAAQRAGGGEIAVEAVIVGGGDQRQKLAPRHRLAAGEMHLQDAQRRRLAQHAAPFRFGQLGSAPLEVHRV
jgi:hypothetical protein